MKARIVILFVVAAGLAVYLATRASAPPGAEPNLSDGLSEKDKKDIRERQKLLWQFDLPGEDVPADLAIQVEVDTSGKKNRLFYYISEAHGYYVETFEALFYYKPTPETTPDDSPLTSNQYINDYVKANETLTGCLEIVPAEIQYIGDTMGTSENWAAEIMRYGRARVENPDPLHPVTKITKCD